MSIGTRAFTLSGAVKVGAIVYPWLDETQAFTACEVVSSSAPILDLSGLTRQFHTRVVVKPLVSVLS